MLDLNLDKINDVLYVIISDTSNSYGTEDYNGLVVLRDIMTDDVTGVTIFDFSKRYKKGNLNSLPFPFKIDIEKEIYANLKM
jgi:hypothetical protein